MTEGTGELGGNQEFSFMLIDFHDNMYRNVNSSIFIYQYGFDNKFLTFD